MNIRKITSLIMCITFVLELITSVVLYIVPQGRVAYWADWNFLGLSKTEWGNQHINLGILFLLAGLFHIFYNWRVIAAYLKNRARKVKVFTASFNAALVLSLVVAAGTYLEIPPMSTVIRLSDSIKDSAAKKYGEPPYGHAELSSLKMFTQKQGLDLDKSLTLLSKAGIVVEDSSMTLEDISTANNISPQNIYILIKEAGIVGLEDEQAVFPDLPMSGFGKKTMAAICTEFNLHFPVIKQGLFKRGIYVEPEQTIKELASENKMTAMAFFEVLHSVVNGQ